MKLLFLFSLLPLFSFTQGFGEYITENAIELNNESKQDSVLYEHFQNYSLIMVGEVHGTKEPAKFVEILSELILQKEESISIGLEIPTNQMAAFIQNPTDSSLRQTKFFTKENTDGRNGQAWFDLISYCNSIPNINLFFFDNSSTRTNLRDSAMYNSVVDQVKQFPNSKVITLSGSIHSWLVPFNDNPTMGNYCINDTVTFSPSKICSINHAFSEGTVLNSTGNGLELRIIEFEENIYSESTDFQNYLVMYETAEPSRHNCLYYTRKVNHSQKIKLD